MMFLRYQFHVHTGYSPDCNISLARLYRVLRKNKISGIAITDHNTIDGALKFKEKYGNQIDVIVGEEIKTEKGEIIGLFLKEAIPPNLTVGETINRIKQQRGIVYVPHPFDKFRKKTCLGRDNILEFKDKIDVIEKFNGRCMDVQDTITAHLLCKEIGKTAINASDAHSVHELKYNRTLIEEVQLSADNFVEVINKSKSENEKTNRIIHLYTKFIRIFKLIKGGKFYEAFKLIYKGCKRKLFRLVQNDYKG